MKSLLDVYCNGGGMSLQFNVFRAETLRDAQIHPEKYKNLQVRVCGWNVLWNNLSRAEQNAYILRAENIGQ
jgi:pyruvate-formate lyase